jgi:hypothetical protein
MPDYFSQNIHTAHYDMEPNNTYKKTWGETVFESRHNEDPAVQNIDYRLNNYGHRSDDFTDKHSGMHVLFAGCSVTFGEAIPYKTNWSGRLYDKLSKENVMDKYFSLGFLNGINSNIVYNILLYCEKFGNPEAIFCVFSDAIRKLEYRDNKFIIEYAPDDRHTNLGRLDSIKSITFLEKYCEASGIKLIWGTWSLKDAKFYSNLNFKDFLFFDDVSVVMKANNKEEKFDPFYSMGRDKSHPGLLYSDGLANLFFEKFKNKYSA